MFPVTALTDQEGCHEWTHDFIASGMTASEMYRQHLALYRHSVMLLCSGKYVT